MTNIQFIHRRPFAITGPASRGGFTVAYQEVEPGLVEYSVATCSTRDHFNKKIGRAVATGRLVNNRHCTTVNTTVKEFRDHIYSSPV